METETRGAEPVFPDQLGLFQGMNLRDWFAGCALSAGSPISRVWEIADSVLAKREDRKL